MRSAYSRPAVSSLATASVAPEDLFLVGAKVARQARTRDKPLTGDHHGYLTAFFVNWPGAMPWSSRPVYQLPRMCRRTATSSLPRAAACHR